MPYDNTNAENVQLGTCSVVFGGTDLGLTKGGTEVQIQTTTHKVTVDQFGSTEINEYIMGTTAMVKVPLAETKVELFATIIPNSTLVVDGTKKKLSVANSTGTSLRSFADKLVLHPVAQPSSEKNFDFVLPISCPKGDFQFAYKLDEERIYNVEFYGYPDLSTGVLYVLGDETAV
jgi:hypothetical protein